MTEDGWKAAQDRPPLIRELMRNNYWLREGIISCFRRREFQSGLDHEYRGPQWELFSSADFVLHFSLHLESMPASSRVMRWIISEGPQNTGHRPVTMSQLMLCNYWVLIPFNKWIVEYLNITIHHYHPPSHHLVQMYLCRGQYSNWYCLWSFSEWIIQYVKDGREFLFQLNSQLEEDIHGDRNVSQHAGMAFVFSWWSREGYTWYCILSDN